MELLAGAPDGSQVVTLTPRQLDYLARVLADDDAPEAVGLRLVLDLDDRVCAGQGLACS